MSKHFKTEHRTSALYKSIESSHGLCAPEFSGLNTLIEFGRDFVKDVELSVSRSLPW